MVDAMLDKARDYPGLVDVDTDLKLNSPQLDIVRRPGKGRRNRHRDRHARPHARDHARRPAGDALQAGGEQYDVVVKVADIDRQNPDDMRRIYVRGARQRDGAALQPDLRQGDGGAEGAQSLQSAACRNDHRAARAWLFVKRGPRISRTDCEGGTAGDRPYRLCRPIARVQGSQRGHLPDLPARARLHLSRACRPVRKLHRSVHHHADRAALDYRRAAGAVVERRHAQHL